MLEICLMIKPLEKLGRTINLTSMGVSIYPILLSLLNITFIDKNTFYYPKNMAQVTLLVAHFFYYLKSMSISSGNILLQLLMTMEQKWHSNKVTCISYFQVIITIIKGLCHVITLSIILYTRGMKPFCGNSNASFHMRDCILRFTLMTKDIGIMLWLNEVQVIIPQSLSLLLYEVTP